MKAAVCYEFDQPLVVEEVEIDPPQRGEVRVKVAAAAICHSDIHHLEGAWGGSLPVILGHEAAGIVEEVGKGVTLTRPGDHVVVSLLRACGRCFFCVTGSPHLCEAKYALDTQSRLRTGGGQSIRHGIKTAAFAEYVIVDQSQVVPVLPEIPLDVASLLACGVITGLGAVVNSARVPPESSVVIIGCGGVGLNAIQGAVLSGAYPIIAADLLDNKLVAARSFGATHSINTANEPAPEAIVKTLTRDRGADYVFVTVGSNAAATQGLNMLRRGGTLVLVGMPPSGAKLLLETVDFVYNGQRLIGSNMGSTRLSVDIPRLVDLYLAKRLKLDELITGRYPLAQINQAIEAVKKGEALRNIIVF